ncbi:hypothetical protein BDY21DRAFT_371332 [Lineolata rhizophorae]|uniref:Uncharacterized protein n=1 Tax=Lineolata rhizophorae TaxID=578093 RepID=A0A6A6P184_9PEZI|nr:hypothetical protein BDY21DRAFT_371332 [Lineolata rhizophorae]
MPQSRGFNGPNPPNGPNVSAADGPAASQLRAAETRPSSRRGASGAWTRLRPPLSSGNSSSSQQQQHNNAGGGGGGSSAHNSSSTSLPYRSAGAFSSSLSSADPLLQYGLPSRGETRLNDKKAQEAFYNKIVERYMKFCGSFSARPEELEREFAAMGRLERGEAELGGAQAGAASKGKKGHEARSTASKAPPSQPSSTTSPKPPPPPISSAARPNPPKAQPSPELPLLLSAMRKLRESILATRRTDLFAQRAYIFIVHAAVLCSAWQSYLPALTYLLHDIHGPSAAAPAGAGGSGGAVAVAEAARAEAEARGHAPLSPPELHEHAAYLILDTACRQARLAAAFALYFRYRPPAPRLLPALRALARGDWVAWWRLRRGVDGYAGRVMAFADEAMGLHALKCLGRGYLGCERRFVEGAVGGVAWGELCEKGGKWNVGWELEGAEEGEEGEQRVVIRRPKVKGGGKG